MARTELELNEIETLTHLVRAKAVEPGPFQGLYKNILSKLNKMFDEEYAEREKKIGIIMTKAQLRAELFRVKGMLRDALLDEGYKGLSNSETDFYKAIHAIWKEMNKSNYD